MSKEIFDTSIIKKQISILESRLKKLNRNKELELENKKLKNQVKQLKDTGIALKQRIKELSLETNKEAILRFKTILTNYPANLCI